MMHRSWNVRWKSPASYLQFWSGASFAALDLSGDTKDRSGAWLDYDVEGYFIAVLFDNSLCRLATADGSLMSDELTFN